ncbi:MAG: hypothetical protein MUF42_10260 [Cytophagaceae bacterium]|jgi:hypothetical protein|nr:hypothetical protein [Cytophagaceae bacterium]
MKNRILANWERIIPAIALVVLLVGYILLDPGLLPYSNAICLFLLQVYAVFMALRIRKLEAALPLLLGVAMTYHHWFAEKFHSVFFILYLVVMSVWGIRFCFTSVQSSLRYRQVELFASLLALSMFYPAIHYSGILGENAYLMVYYFASAFLIAYIMYNENLWDNYSKEEKYMLTVLLIFQLFEIGLISLS